MNNHHDGQAYAEIYARVSTEDQGKGFSSPTQIEACQKLADRKGYAVAETSVLVDEGLPGTTMDRPQLRKLRELVNNYAIAATIGRPSEVWPWLCWDLLYFWEL
jgi:DNA invertase Pin-like site-specific DNA recombinase